MAMLSTGELTFGLDHNGLVIWEFSNDSNNSASDAGVVDEW
jgi:hypothetical protein